MVLYLIFNERTGIEIGKSVFVAQRLIRRVKAYCFGPAMPLKIPRFPRKWTSCTRGVVTAWRLVVALIIVSFLVCDVTQEFELSPAKESVEATFPDLFGHKIGSKRAPLRVYYKLLLCERRPVLQRWSVIEKILEQVLAFSSSQYLILKVECSCKWFHSLTWTGNGSVNFRKSARDMRMYLSGEGQKGRIVKTNSMKNRREFGGNFDDKGSFCRLANSLQQTTPKCIVLGEKVSHHHTILEEFLSFAGTRFIIFKPRAAAGGAGIKVYSRATFDADHSTRSGILQVYLDDPVLYNGFKTDIRVYFVITSLQPLTLFISRRGMFRSAYPWKSFNKSVFDPAADITNYSFRVKATKYVPNRDAQENDNATLGTLRKYARILDDAGLNPEDVWSNIKENITLAVLALYPKMLTSSQGVEGSIFIADLLITTTGHASVLEIMANTCALKPKKEFPGDNVVWSEVTDTVLNGYALLSLKGLLPLSSDAQNLCYKNSSMDTATSATLRRVLVEIMVAHKFSFDPVLPLDYVQYKEFLIQQKVDTHIYDDVFSCSQNVT